MTNSRSSTDVYSILVVNIGTPSAHAWFDRLPRLDVEEVVNFASGSVDSPGSLLSRPVNPENCVTS